LSYNKSTPLVSIVLPTYNGASYIRDSIESCLKQSYQNIEIIIVNDASTDNTATIIEEYNRRYSRVKVLHHSKNRKLPAALNTGFHEAKGRFLTWTSDDNMYRDNAVSVLLTYIMKNEKVSLVYSDYSVINCDGVVISEVCLPPLSKILEMNVIGACFLYKREVFDELGGYDSSRFLVEDYEYWLRVASTYKLMHLPRDLYFYREHENSLTSQQESAVNEEKHRLLF